jgi:hypothetical protein
VWIHNGLAPFGIGGEWSSYLPAEHASELERGR